MSNWKVVSRKKIRKARYFDVEQEKIVSANGEEFVYESVIRKPCVSIIPLSKNNDIYMIKQYRYLFDDYILEFPSGHIEEKETPLIAAKKELKEETGLKAENWKEIGKLEGSASVIRSSLYLFLAKDLKEGKSNPEHGEDIELVKIPLKKAVEKVIKGEISTLSTMYAILLLEKLINQEKL